MAKRWSWIFLSGLNKFLALEGRGVLALEAAADKVGLNMKLGCAPFGTVTALFAVLTVMAKPAEAGDVVVSPLQIQQRIDGFGASSAWTAGNMSATDADLLFSADRGVGLSLLRVHIRPCDTTSPCQPTTDEIGTAQLAVARGASVWATPWTPPKQWKSIVNADAGQSLDNGSLLTMYYDDWANALVAFAGWMHSNGVDLVGLSAQNEPDFKCTNYECCTYSAQQLDDFVSNHLGPAFNMAGLLIPPFKLIAPETQGWTNLPRFSSTLLGDAGVYVGTIATHEYNGTPSSNPAIAGAGKTFWETEISDTRTTGADPGMGSALYVAGLMRDALVVANVNAWHYWWIRPNAGTSDNSALWDNQAGWTKRLFAMGNYSKFVRPGYYRVNATTYPSPSVSVTAYAESPSSNPLAGQLVIVAINSADTASSQTFLFDGASTDPAWTAWVTSSTADILSQAPVPAFINNQLAYDLPPQSVTTLLGSITGTGPAVSAPPPSSSSGGQAGSGGSDAGNGAQPSARSSPGANSGLACSATGAFSMAGARYGAIGAGALVVLLAMARRSARRGRTTQRSG
jgi:glucuronoarabinoxylan endo-1,4-beta-xylanase